MKDRLSIRGLCVETRIGVTERERSRPQDVLIDLEITTDHSRAAASDSLTDTIDYDALITAVSELVRKSECNLLERLGSDIAGLVADWSGVDGVTVTVGKQDVPVNEEVDSVSVQIHRGGAE